MPVFFFISSMIASVSMRAVFEGALSTRTIHNKMDETHLREADGVARLRHAAGFVLIGYFIIKVLDTMDNDWHYLASGSGAWLAAGCVSFMLLPAPATPSACAKRTSRSLVTASVFGVSGIVVNRFNVCLVAFG